MDEFEDAAKYLREEEIDGEIEITWLLVEVEKLYNPYEQRREEVPNILEGFDEYTTFLEERERVSERKDIAEGLFIQLGDDEAVRNVKSLSDAENLVGEGLSEKYGWDYYWIVPLGDPLTRTIHNYRAQGGSPEEAAENAVEAWKEKDNFKPCVLKKYVEANDIEISQANFSATDPNSW